MSAGGDVIQPGQSIPDDVIGVEDNEGDHWTRTARGHWHLASNSARCERDDSCRSGTANPANVYAPLTVTAVREQPAEPEPQQTDASPLLDLVQARDANGEPLWQHVCGGVEQSHERPQPHACDNDTGPWRRLLVAADAAWMPARPGDTPGELVPGEADFPQPVDAAPDGDRAPKCPHGYEYGDHHWWGCMGVKQPIGQPDLMAQVMAELDVDRPEDVLPALRLGEVHPAVPKLRRERDEARAEVERLKAELADEEEGRREDWVNRLSAQPDPLVLRLPEVPEGAVALVSVSTSARWVRHDLAWRHEQGGENGAVRNLAEILWIEHLGKGGLRVEMAPPREPRTWPRLDRAPKDIKAVRGASGRIYRRNVHTATFEAGMVTISHLQELDGPLTEVFDDEPGGTASPEVQR